MKDSGAVLFCTSYFRDAATWQARYSRWIEHHQAFPWLCRAIVMIDDGSPHEPERSQLTAIAAADIGKRALPRRALVRFPNNLGRAGTTVYPGWCRSFLFSLDIAESYGFRKIVHVESDTYLLSSGIVDYIQRTRTGWTAFWSARYQFPETALQIICSDAFPALAKIRDAGPDAFRGQPAEMVLPFTRVEKSFVGDRFSEFQAAIPPNADYAVQVEPTMYVRRPRSLRYRLRRVFSPVPHGSLEPVRGPSVPGADELARMSDGQARECAFKAGLVAYHHGYFDSAKRCLERATELDPQSARARMLLGACCLKLGDSRAALQEALASLRIDPDDARTESLVAEIYGSTGSLELAIEHYVKALELEPAERAPLNSIRVLEMTLKKGAAAGDLAESKMRAKLTLRLKSGDLDERGYRTLLLVGRRTRDGLRELLPVANVVATYRTFDMDEVQALAEVFDATGDSARRDQFRTLLRRA
jgi:tetratricopeptide (TPR) repeat protein